MPSLFFSRALMLGMIVCLADAPPAAAQFTPLGGEVGGGVRSRLPGPGISGDGAAVVGEYRFAAGQDLHPFRRIAETVIDLGTLDGNGGLAFSASFDGSVVVGYSGNEAFRWDGSMHGLGGAGGGSVSRAWGVSADGSVVSGALGPAGGPLQAFRWTQPTGIVPLGTFGVYVGTRGEGMSADGATIAGWGHETNFDLQQAARWSVGGGWVPLGFLPGKDKSSAHGISANGQVIVGASWVDFPTNREAFRWSETSGMVSLGDLPGGALASIALDACADGSIIVGAGDSANGSEAFVWDGFHGMRALRDVLIAEGADLTGWSLTVARGISDDGRWIVGEGINPDGLQEAWVAQIAAVPEPSALLLLGAVGAGLLLRRWWSSP